MKITKTQLRRIVKEELTKELNEQGIDEVFGAMKAMARAVVPGGMTGDDEIKLQIKQDEAKNIKKNPDGPGAAVATWGIISLGAGKETAMLLSRMLNYDQILALVIAAEWVGPKGDSHINRVVDMMGIELAHTLKGAVDTVVRYSEEHGRKVSFEDFGDNVRRAYGAFGSMAKEN